MGDILNALSYRAWDAIRRASKVTPIRRNGRQWSSGYDSFNEQR